MNLEQAIATQKGIIEKLQPELEEAVVTNPADLNRAKLLSELLHINIEALAELEEMRDRAAGVQIPGEVKNLSLNPRLQVRGETVVDDDGISFRVAKDFDRR